MKNRSFPIASVTDKAALSIRAGHPWVYAEEITSMTETPENGALVDVVSRKGAYLGTGLLSEQSKIRVRLLSSNPNDAYDRAFFRRRLRYAVEYRKNVMKEDFFACRLVFGEADGLPGVTVDYYSGLLSVQILSYGMELRKAMLYEELFSVLEEAGYPALGLFERNDVAIRALEGLNEEKGWYEALPHPDSPVTEITENGVIYEVDIENGQKTGFFLDQKYNRLAASRLAEGKTVLDCFTHTGSFALNAAKGGAKHVTAVDISAEAVKMAEANARRNHLEDRMDFLKADVFDLLPRLAAERAPYDFVILDPPAFTKSRSTVASAERGYKEINFRAMKLLPRGGFLATCSCSHFMKPALFESMLKSAADDASVQLKLIEVRRQAPDHPVIFGIPETDYLKFYLFQVI